MSYLSSAELDELDKRLDLNIRTFRLLSLSLESAIQSLFFFIESLPPQSGPVQDMARFNAARVCVFWIYKFCQSSPGDTVVDWEMASELFSAAMNYSLAWDFLSGSFTKRNMPPLYQAELCDGVITFSAINPTRHAKAITENLCHDKYDFDFDDLQLRSNAFIDGHADQLVRQARPRHLSEQLFDINEPIEFCRSYSAFLRSNMNHAWLLNPAWDIGGYTIGEYRSVIEAMLSQSIARRRIRLWLQQLNPGSRYWLSLVPIGAKKDIVNGFQLITGMDETSIENIVDDLTLHQGHPFGLDDIPHIPFFEVRDGQLCWSLFFTDFMNPELTIWRILGKIRKASIEDYKKPRAVMQAERLQTDLLLRTSFQPNQIKLDIDVPKPNSTKRDTDIDMLLIDESDNFALVVQLKWIAPPIAVKNYHQDFDALIEGIEQADKSLRWLREQPDQVSKALGLPLPVVKSLEFEAVIVGRNSMGKSRLEESKHPIVNETIFRWYLLDRKVSLRALWHSLKENLYFATGYSLQDIRDREFDGVKFAARSLAVLEYPKEFGPDQLCVWTKEANALTHEKIAESAHELWLNSGCTHGHDVEDWLQAESRLRASR